MIFHRPPEPSKWLEFVHLCDALATDGCPVCALIEQACYRYLDHLFYECVNDAGVRQRLAASRGFCNVHAHLALRVPHPDSGLAIIYADLLRQPELPATATCPVCDVAEFTARSALSELLRWFTDEELQAKYRPAFGLCLPHLRQARTAFAGHPNLPALVAAETEKLAALRAELLEYSRKLDYRFANEPKGREQTSWRRVVEKFVGKREIFTSPERNSHRS